MITNLLDVSLQLFEVSGEIPLNFLEAFIGILIGAVGITGVGIILYCLILKVVVLPLDIWQKATMRKQSLKMEKMRGQLEKLQAQYANTPELYQKKMQEVYKENNFNMFASCIPMIASLVILIIAWQSLTGFSQHMNLSFYTGMAQAYDAAILQHCELDDPVQSDFAEDAGYYAFKGEGEEQYIYYIQNKTDPSDIEYKIDTQKLMGLHADLTTEADCEEYVKGLGRTAAAAYYGENRDGFLWIQNIFYPDVAWAHPLQSYDDFCNAITREIEVEVRTGNGTETESVRINDFINENTYNEITYDLEEAKSQPNGYFVLVVLTILANVGSQLIAMRSQKAQRELQTADKSSQNMQKWMMFIIPVLFCVFAFIYSAAFSLYLITSSLFSLVSTLVVNRVIDSVFKKKNEAEERAQANYGGRKALTRDWERNRAIMGKDNKENKDKKNKRR